MGSGNTNAAIPHDMATLAQRGQQGLNEARLGERVEDLETSALHVLEIPVIIAANSVPASALIPCKAKIVDAFVRCTTTNASGTLTLKDGSGNVIAAAMACATSDAIARAASIAQAYNQVAAGAKLQVSANGAGDRGIMHVVYEKLQ